MPDNLHTGGAGLAQANPAPRTEPGLTELVTGIVRDAEELLKQQLTMFKAEFKEDVRNTKEAVIPLFIGIGLSLIGGLFLLVAVALVLNRLGLPEWASFGIVGGALLVGGVVLFIVGRNKFASFNPLPDKTVEALKENVQWLTTKK